MLNFFWVWRGFFALELAVSVVQKILAVATEAELTRGTFFWLDFIFG